MSSPKHHRRDSAVEHLDGPALKFRKETLQNLEIPRRRQNQNEAASLPRFTLEEIYNPSYVTILTAGKTFYLREELLTSESGYFKRALRIGKVCGLQTDTLHLEDIEAENFECFLHYIQTGTISEEASTWSWRTFINLYLLAAFLSSPGFQTAIFVQIQRKALRLHYFPSPCDLALLPPESLLYSFFVELYVGQGLTSHPEEFQTACTAFRSRQIAASMCYECGLYEDGKCSTGQHEVADGYDLEEKGWCFWHVHERKEEEKLCAARWKAEVD